MFKKLLITFFVLLNIVYAQSSSDDLTQQIWADYNPQFDLNEKYTLYGSLAGETIIPYSWTQLYFTAAVRFAPDPLFNILNKSQQQLHGGLSVYYTINEDNPNQIELRPFQAYKISWPNFKRVRFTHLLELDERFFFTISKDEFDFDLRTTYTLEAIFHRTKHLIDFADGFYLPISVEFFVNLYSTQVYSNAIKFTPGLGYSSLSDGWKIQFDLSYRYTENDERSYFSKSTIIYRLRFYQSFN